MWSWVKSYTRYKIYIILVIYLTSWGIRWRLASNSDKRVPITSGDSVHFYACFEAVTDLCRSVSFPNEFLHLVLDASSMEYKSQLPNALTRALTYIFEQTGHSLEPFYLYLWCLFFWSCDIHVVLSKKSLVFLKAQKQKLYKKPWR